ncbi:hypothetical protein GCM10009730_59610 [Streptomyces albidochromogenes]|uniref:transposase n=1 Tax=Streptomyces albidochromogenes TaxID=329524 RepID=UPI00110F92BF|nr:transposase [Streptomyces albidochromogenes]
MAGTGEGRLAGSLSIGARVHWQEREWEVVEWQGPQVTLLPQDRGEAPRAVSYRWLVGAQDFAALTSGAAPVADCAVLSGCGRQEGRQEEAELWQARMVEIDTGLAPGRSEHERGFGPETTLAQRCAAMSARLAADGIRCSAYTLADKRRTWKAAGENPAVLLPGTRDKRPGGFTDLRCLTAMQEVVARRAHESDVTIELIREEVEDLLHSRYGEELGDPVAVAALLPSRSTFYLRMKESGLADALARPTRARAALASTPPLPHGGREAVLRPGQVTQVDTTPLRILAQGRSHKKRGRGIDRMPLFTIAELQQMAQEWVALEYQQTSDAGLRDPFRPGIVLSPNGMYALQVARSGYRPLPLSPAQSRFFLLPRWVIPGKGGFMINYRTYQPVAQDAGHYREILLRGGSKLVGRGGKWECRFNPYRPERVWLYDHTAGTWVTCDFRLRHLRNDPWTADMWQEHAEQHRAAGGSAQDEEAIALSLAQRDRRRRSRRPPPERTGAEPPFQGLEVETEHPSQDPYAGLEEFDLSTLRPRPALPISPMAPPPVSVPAALPAGADTGGEQEGGQNLHPLAALFADADDTGSPPDAPAAGTPAEAYEVVEAELLKGLDSGADDGSYEDGEDVIDVWEERTPGGMGP